MDCSNEIVLDDSTLDKLVREIPHLPSRGHAARAVVGSHRGGVYKIKVPKRSVDELIAAAVLHLKKK